MLCLSCAYILWDLALVSLGDSCGPRLLSFHTSTFEVLSGPPRHQGLSFVSLCRTSWGSKALWATCLCHPWPYRKSSLRPQWGKGSSKVVDDCLLCFPVVLKDLSETGRGTRSPSLGMDMCVCVHTHTHNYIQVWYIYIYTIISI